LAIFRELDLTHLKEDGFGGTIFAKKTQTGRMDSMTVMGRLVLRPFFEGAGPRPMFREPNRGSTRRGAAFEDWVKTRTHSGLAAGYAAAGESYLLAFPFLAAWSVALLALRLLRPRPAWGLLWRQPGWWASFGATTAILVASAVETFLEIPTYTVVVPIAVMLAWLVLGVVRRWEAESSWIDRAGRCLGIAWIALIPVYVVGFVLNHG
jgi:hypothetical protein